MTNPFVPAQAVTRAFRAVASASLLPLVPMLLATTATSVLSGCIETEGAGSYNSPEPGPNYSTLGCGDTCGNSASCMATCQSMDGPTAPMLHEYR